MSRIRTFILLVILCSLFSRFNSGAVRAENLKNLLVLFKTSEGVTAANNQFRWYLHPALEKSGYQITYFDIEDQFPTPAELENINAIVTWFNSAIIKNPERYLDWLAQQILQRRKVIILDNLGAYSADGTTWLTNNALNRFFLPFGLEFNGNWTNNPELLEVVRYNPAFVGNDLSVTEKILNHYFYIKSIHPQNQSYFILQRKDLPESASHLIVQTPFGGLAMQNYISEFSDGRQRFFLDVVKFVQACLEQPIQAELLPSRQVLALLKRAENNEPTESLIHRFAFKPLLDLGYSTTYHFVEDGLPAPATMQAYAAILTWFQTPDMLNGEKYLEWAQEQIQAGRKIIILGNLGCFKVVKQVNSEAGQPVEVNWWLSRGELNNFLYPFGLEFLGGWLGDPNLLQVKFKASSMVEKDLPLRPENLKHYYTWRSVHPENKIFLEVERSDQPNSASAFILRTPFGGMAFEGYLMQWDANQQRLNFYLNIPAFLQECLNYVPQSRLQPLQLITHREILAQEPSKIPKMLAPKPAPISPLPDASTEIKRWILALYDRAEVPDLDENPIRKRAEIILNHLGLVVQHWDIQQGFPGAAEMEKYRGILTWFQDGTMHAPEKYTKWLREQIHAGRKVVLLGNFGAFYEDENNLSVAGAQEFFQESGLRYWDVKISPGKQQQVRFQSPTMLNFEAPVDLTRMAPFTTKITSEHPANQVFLTIEDESLGWIDAVVVTPFGGIALDDAPFQEGQKDAKWVANLQAVLNGAGDLEKAETDPIGFWRINPFKFFEAAFDLKGNPSPDFTTLNGRRIFYSHIDGDGLIGISLIDSKSYASEFVRDQILTQYPLPFSASVISKEIEDNLFPFYNRPLVVARSIFALENVEAGTHSYSHPFNWRTGDLSARTKDHQLKLEIEAIDYDLETLASVKFIEKNLLPPQKSVKLYLWTGQCNPDERALSRVDNLDIQNINWGDPIYDSHFPSYSCLAPLATNVNGYWQFHTSASNDFIYTKGWTRNFGNMAQLVEHFQYTESPIRILPLNIYLHYYIGDREAGLTGLKKAYDYCMQQAIAPLFTSDFVNIGRDFIAFRTFKLPAGGYRVLHDGTLRTLRFDHCTQYPDLKRSQGVMGFLQYQGALYVHLGAGNVQTIYLQPTAPTAVYLKTGSHYIDNWQFAPNGGQFACRGVGKAGFELANLLPTTTYQVRIEQINTATEARATIQSEAIQTDPSGILKFETIFKAYQGEYLITFTQL